MLHPANLIIQYWLFLPRIFLIRNKYMNNKSPLFSSKSNDDFMTYRPTDLLWATLNGINQLQNTHLGQIQNRLWPYRSRGNNCRFLACVKRKRSIALPIWETVLEWLKYSQNQILWRWKLSLLQSLNRESTCEPQVVAERDSKVKGETLRLPHTKFSSATCMSASAVSHSAQVTDT